jgi:hypothetical protein
MVALSAGWKFLRLLVGRFRLLTPPGSIVCLLANVRSLPDDEKRGWIGILCLLIVELPGPDNTNSKFF